MTKELIFGCEASLLPTNATEPEQVFPFPQFDIVAAMDGLHVCAKHQLRLRRESDPTVGDSASEHLESSWTGLRQEYGLSHHLGVSDHVKRVDVQDKLFKLRKSSATPTSSAREARICMKSLHSNQSK